MVNQPFPEQIDALPIRVRPRPGELADSFVCRLARANHIKSSYLHGLVHGPPLWAGAPKIDRLALFSGIPETVLERTLLNVAASLMDIKSTEDQSEEEDARQRLHFRIRRDADGRGLTVRALAERHNVSRRTVRRALNAPEPSPDRLIRRIPARVEPLKQVIDPMLVEGLAPKQIWVRLIDDHSIALHFDRIVHYAKAWHLARTRPEQPPLIQFPADTKRVT